MGARNILQMVLFIPGTRQPNETTTPPICQTNSHTASDHVGHAEQSSFQEAQKVA